MREIHLRTSFSMPGIEILYPADIYRVACCLSVVRLVNIESGISKFFVHNATVRTCQAFANSSAPTERMSRSGLVIGFDELQPAHRFGQGLDGFPGMGYCIMPCAVIKLFPRYPAALFRLFTRFLIIAHGDEKPMKIKIAVILECHLARVDEVPSGVQNNAALLIQDGQEPNGRGIILGMP